VLFYVDRLSTQTSHRPFDLLEKSSHVGSTGRLPVMRRCRPIDLMEIVQRQPRQQCIDSRNNVVGEIRWPTTPFGWRISWSCWCQPIGEEDQRPSSLQYGNRSGVRSSQLLNRFLIIRVSGPCCRALKPTVFAPVPDQSAPCSFDVALLGLPVGINSNAEQRQP